jgi:hypothetical protein
MRKLILVAAMVLASATAQAGVSRGLTLASNDEAPAAEPAKAVEAPKEAPKYVERPAAVDTAVQAPKAEAAKPAGQTTDAPKTGQTRAEKPKHKRGSTEARVIYELHRHGIYW